MADFNEKFRVVMLQGAKGDAYDDTQLRQDINEMLANTPYIKYTEDVGFELPIETINDEVASSNTVYSSNKINELISGIIDDSQEGETSETTTMSANKLSGIISQLNQNIDGIYNDVVTLNTQKWRYVGTLNNSDTRSLRVDFTEAETSTVIILTINNVNAEGNNIFLYRKTMLTPPITSNAWQIAGVNMSQDEIKVFGDYIDEIPYIFVTNNAPQSSGIGCAVYIMYLN